MKLKVYAILDTVSATYAQPHCSINDGTAVRSCLNLIQRDESIKGHESDYALYRIGEYDDQSGFLKAEEKPELIVRLNTLLKMGEEK